MSEFEEKLKSLRATQDYFNDPVRIAAAKERKAVFDREVEERRMNRALEGTDPAELLSGDLSVVYDFLALAEQHEFPGATHLYVKGPDVKLSQGFFAKYVLRYPPIERRQTYPFAGYEIGRKIRQPVLLKSSIYLCSDGRLREVAHSDNPQGWATEVTQGKFEVGLPRFTGVWSEGDRDTRASTGSPIYEFTERELSEVLLSIASKAFPRT